MGNEFMTLVKDTALARIIGVTEITSFAESMQSRHVTILPVVIAGIFYLVMNSVVSKCFAAAEKRLGYYSP
jgi:polar amino acid transport system permease protein